MANKDNPKGGKVIQTLVSANFNPSIHKYIIPTSDANNYFINDIVKTNETSVDGIPVIVKGTPGDILRGVIISIEANLPVTDTSYRKGGEQVFVYVCDDPFVELEMQINGVVESYHIGQFINLIEGTGDIYNGTSTTQLDIATLDSTNGQFRILGIIEDPINSLGLYAKVRVMIHKHELGGDAGAASDLWIRSGTTINPANDGDTLDMESGSMTFNVGATINEFSTDGTLLGNSNDALPTEKAVKTYVDTAVLAEDFWDRTGTVVTLKNAGDTLQLETSSGLQFGPTGQNIVEFSIDGTLGDDSDTAVPTEKAVKTYVDNAILAEDFWDRAGTTVSLKNAGDTLEFDATGGIEFSGGGQNVVEFSIDGTLAGDSDTVLPTEKAVKTYVDGHSSNDMWTRIGTDITLTNAGDDVQFDSTGGVQFGGAGQNINEFSIDGTLVGDSDTALPTEKAVKNYVDTHIANGIWTRTGTEVTLTNIGDTIGDTNPLKYTSHPTFVADEEIIDKKYLDDRVPEATQEALDIDFDGKTSFTLSQIPSGPDAFGLFLNGILKREGASYDYTFSGTTLTWNDPGSPPLTLKTTDELIAWYNYSGLQAGAWTDDGTDVKTIFDPRNVNLQNAGFKDTNVTTAVKLGDVSNTSLNTTNKTIIGAVNEIVAGLPVQKEIFYAATDYQNNYFNYRVKTIGASSSFRFVFFVPHDYISMVSMKMVAIVSPGAAGANRDIDISVDYGGLGDLFDRDSHTDTTTLYNFTGKTNKIEQVIDITTAIVPINPILPGDFVAVFVDHKSIGGNLYYLGVRLVYNA